MNAEHLEMCASAAWLDALRDMILPYALADARLGDDGCNPVHPDGVGARLSAAGFGDVEIRSNDFGWAAQAHR